MSFLCDVIGHKLGPVKPVYAFTGKWKDELGNTICYRARICERCDKRIPATEEDAIEKRKKEAEISSVMNASRASLGLPPISWER